MRLLFSTADYVRAGRPRVGFPLIVGSDMAPLEPFHSFLESRLLGVNVPPGKRWGGKLKLNTQEAYGRAVWDYARFLWANELPWDERHDALADSLVSRYRDWSFVELGLNEKTINKRLRLVAELYDWALFRGLIDQLPFSRTDVTVRGIQLPLAHLNGGQVTTSKLDQELDEWAEEPEFLTGDQVRLARGEIRRTGQRLAFDLMTRVGLRSCETRTFPLKYVFDPRRKAYLKPGHVIEVRLDPADMEIKFDKPRTVHVPYDLMVQLHKYTLLERNVDVREGVEPRELLLTREGNAYSKDSMVKIFTYLSDRVGYRVRPLMLRHSYAIHMLLYLRKHPEIPVEPLLYVRDRLGHAHVQTTMIYLTQIDRLLGEEALAMMAEFDSLYDVGSALQGIGVTDRAIDDGSPKVN